MSIQMKMTQGMFATNDIIKQLITRIIAKNLC